MRRQTVWAELTPPLSNRKSRRWRRVTQARCRRGPEVAAGACISPTSAPIGCRSSGVIGQDREGSSLKWRDGTEMPLVEADDATGLVAPCKCDHSAVGKPKFEVRITCIG